MCSRAKEAQLMHISTFVFPLKSNSLLPSNIRRTKTPCKLYIWTRVIDMRAYTDVALKPLSHQFVTTIKIKIQTHNPHINLKIRFYH